METITIHWKHARCSIQPLPVTWRTDSKKSQSNLLDIEKHLSVMVKLHAIVMGYGHCTIINIYVYIYIYIKLY